MRTSALGGAVFALGLLAAGCTPRGEGPAADSTAAVAPGAATLRNDADAALRAMETDVNGLEARVATLPENARGAVNEAIGDFRATRDDLRGKIDRVGTATADDIDDLRTEIEEGQDKAADAVANVRLRLATTKAEFTEAANARLAALDRRIDRLARDSTRAAADTRDEAADHLGEIREARRDLTERMGRLAAATDDGFADLRGDLAGALDGLAGRLREGAHDVAEEAREAADSVRR